MLKTPTFDLERQYPAPVAGIDEAGCGPWAGPVVAAAVIIDQQKFPSSFSHRVKDSKKLSKKQREILYHELIAHPSVIYHIGIATVAEIDALNISQATQLAMMRAVKGLPTLPFCALVDGIRKPALDCLVHTVIKGDQTSFSIAAASILAKVTRDGIMQALHHEYPAYGWQKNAGYGTVYHIQALQVHGVTTHHRRSFAPIRALLSNSPL